MSESKNTLYIKIDKNIVVKDRNVRLSDFAKMECTDQAALRKLKQKKIYTFPEGCEKGAHGHNQMAFSILKIIEQIHEDYPGLDVTNEGESDFILEYLPGPAAPAWVDGLKTVLLCVIIFFGAAFTIMAFNNDIGITDIFEKFYTQVTGSAPAGVTELEVCYCIGLALGITVFFNHVGHKKITHDPTPIQIEMRKYENDIDTTFIDNASRKGHSIDVD